LHEQTLARRLELLGEDDPQVADSIANIARILRYRNLLEESKTMQRDALVRRRKLPPEGEYPTVAISLTELGLIRRVQGRTNEAAQFLRDAFDLRTKVLRSDDSTLAESAENLALVLCDLGEFVEAEKLARQSLAIREQNYPDDWRCFNAQAIVGAALLGQENYPVAATNLLAGYQGMKEREDRIPFPDKRRLNEVRESIVQLYEATGPADEAAKWRSKPNPTPQKP
jgi:tetratricopeptide (TPR) repeat protein